MKIGLIGTNRSGKTTLLSLLSGLSYEISVAAQLGGKIRNVFIKIPEPRLDTLANEFGRDKNLIPPSVELLDTNPIGLDQVTRLKNSEVLSVLREMDGLIIIIRAYEDEGGDFAPSIESIDKQASDIRSELFFADLEIVEKRIDKLASQLTKSLPTHEADKKELEILQQMKEALHKNQSLQSLKLDAEGSKLLKGFGLLIQKPLVFVFNIAEIDINTNRLFPLLQKYSPGFVSCLKLELELSNLSPEERGNFLAEYGLNNLVAAGLIKACYETVGLITFFTIGKDEIRGWSLRHGENAVTAAGKVHTDIARGFISAEVLSFSDWLGSGSFKNAREHGKVRLEGKNYLVHDGDIIHFKFNI